MILAYHLLVVLTLDAKWTMKSQFANVCQASKDHQPPVVVTPSVSSTQTAPVIRRAWTTNAWTRVPAFAVTMQSARRWITAPFARARLLLSEIRSTSAKKLPVNWKSRSNRINLHDSRLIRIYSIFTAQPVDPCYPSPCGQNGHCRVINGIASCTYPECIINQDCSRDKACFGQKCRDPCVGACGINALCQVVNHDAVCSCPAGYYGEPKQQCRQELPPGTY